MLALVASVLLVGAGDAGPTVAALAAPVIMEHAGVAPERAQVAPIDPDAPAGVDAGLSLPARSSDGATERTWFGWLSGFVGVIVVLGVAATLVLVIRSKRGNPAARRSRDPSSR